MNLTVKSISYKKHKKFKNIVNWNILVTLLKQIKRDYASSGERAHKKWH